jgi:hypothetical protein
MRSGSSLSRRGALLIAIISPALLGSQFKCVAISNPTVATARIEQIEPDMPRVGEIMRVTGNGNGTPPLQFAWEFGDGTTAAGMQAAHAYLAPGSYRLTFIVRDVNGNTDSDSAQVNVADRISSSVLSLALVTVAVAGQPVLFAAVPLEDRAHTSRYEWTFSGGQSSIGPRAAAIFPAAGMYLASVTMTNDRGTIVAAETAFHVADAAE